MKQSPGNFVESAEVLRPLTAEIALGETTTLREPKLLDKWVLWLEQRPHQAGRSTALIRPWGNSQLSAQELTPAPINLRSRVHTYGGGALASHFEGDLLILVWIDDLDRCLWTQSWKVSANPSPDQKRWFDELSAPVCLSCKSESAFADGVIDPWRKLWIGVMESDGKDYLVSFSLTKQKQNPIVIYRPEDFVGYLALSPDGSQLAWVEWQQSAMPWIASQLCWGTLNGTEEIQNRKLFIGASVSLAQTQSTSVFQPVWMPNGQLIVSEDSSGWWNVISINPKSDLDNETSYQKLWRMEAETAMPQWVYGMSTKAIAGDKIVTAICDKGSWSLKLLSLDGLITDFDQPFDDLAGIHAEKDRAVAIASNSLNESGLLEIDLSLGCWRHSMDRKPLILEENISIPEPIWFRGFGGELTHAWYYPPLNWNGTPAPLLVKSHSGPTAMAAKGLNLTIQFWTSRGWGVVDVNYGGSTGFGREYRERLKEGWGVVDVVDCSEAAKTLIELGKADSELIAIEGGSAGGFTTLACLCFTDVFRVGACRYAVSDLIAMTKETHRFEAGYLDHLVGSWPESRDRYLARSPINHAEKINCPVIFFQGMNDPVVLPYQTQKMADALRKKNLPVEVHTFQKEGHGFRDSAIKVKVLKRTEKFFRKHLKL